MNTTNATNSPNDQADPPRAQRAKMLTHVQSSGWVQRIVRRIVLFFTPVYDLKYDERHVAVYGMTALQKVAQKLKNKAQQKEEKANA